MLLALVSSGLFVGMGLTLLDILPLPQARVYAAYAVYAALPLVSLTLLNILPLPQVRTYAAYVALPLVSVSVAACAYANKYASVCAPHAL
jgi:hypothetical protein